MNLLLIEDNDQDAQRMAKLLAAGCDDGIRMRHVHTCAGGLQALGEQSFDIVLLDLSLPETTDSIAAQATVASLVKQHSATPFVLLSGRDNIDEAVHAVRLGVQDYLVKGRLDMDRLQRAIRFAIERKYIERQLDFLAGYDPLTSLVNRQRLQTTAEHALANAERQSIGTALLFIDLDHFKAVNDLWGHAAGDELLAAAAHRIQRAIRRGDTAARLGGDEFAVLLEGADRFAAETVATKILRGLARPFVIAGQAHKVTASIGLALYPDHGEDLGALLQNADRAMYAAKAGGANGWRWPEPPAASVMSDNNSRQKCAALS
jgi:diguanylate cyclase (GGDEF)-like protein